MDKHVTALFSSEEGKKIYCNTVQTMEDNRMTEKLRSGVLVGFSGGADSVMLMCFLWEFRRKNFHFPIVAVHINHMIRELEADRDEAFTRLFAETMGVEYICRKIDVLTLAANLAKGIEECARDVRYSEFSEIISSRDDVSCIAVAHNSNDNAETSIMNILRGSGIKGAAGIAPTRDNIIRPLIRTKKSDIVNALDNSGIKYVSDSTNYSLEYMRNFVRHEVFEKLRQICRRPEDKFLRFTENLRRDDDFILSVADEFVLSHPTITTSALKELHPAVFARVLKRMTDKYDVSLSSHQISAIKSLLDKSKFEYYLTGGVRFVAERGVCFICTEKESEYDYRFSVRAGKRELRGYDADFILSARKKDNSSLNVYKISIQADLSSAIINGSLYLRPRRDGDTVFYGGCTRKLKKLFNDRKIPPSLRGSIPILCDDSGVLWVPGFGVRDDNSGKERGSGPFATLGIGKGDKPAERRLRSASEFTVIADEANKKGMENT